jgi:cytidylate kinase
MSDSRPRAPVIVAIDGPAASGKSSVARALATRLGFLFVNSGAMYRAVTWSVVTSGVDSSDPDAVAGHLRRLAIACGVREGQATVTIDGVDPGDALVAPEVNDNVSPVARVSEVRETLVSRQREYAKLGSLVMEGRDIGTIVFPHTPYKFYIDASQEVRDARRRSQGLNDDLAARDRQDRSRENSPLAIAADATVIDSSHLTIDEVVETVIAAMRAKGFEAP